VGTLRYGMIALGTSGRRAWLDSARMAEDMGFDTLWVADHVGLFDPFTALVAASAVTSRMRLGTYVLNVEFWNPLLLARAAATTDLLTGGRLVLGLGAGYAEIEFRQAGLDYPAAAHRVRRLEATVAAVDRLLAGESVDDEVLGLQGAAVGFRPHQERIPLLVGGNGDRVLRLAGTRADTAGLVGLTSGTAQVHRRLTHWTWSGLAERVALVRESARAANRRQGPELDVLIQRVIVTGDRESAAGELATSTGTPAEQHLDSPFVLIGNEAEIAGQLTRLHEDVGVDAVTVFDSRAAALAPIIRRLRD
jgi:probable F420-dependent oxidoreductase